MLSVWVIMNTLVQLTLVKLECSLVPLMVNHIMLIFQLGFMLETFLFTWQLQKIRLNFMSINQVKWNLLQVEKILIQKSQMILHWKNLKN